MADAVPTLPAPPPGAEVLHQDPLVWTLDALLSRAECEHIVRLAEPGLRRAEVSGDRAGQHSQGRTNAVVWLPHAVDTKTAAICHRIAALVGLPLDHAESMQVIRYDEGQEYRAHFDAYDLTTPRGQRCCARGGQRLVTALAYLTDVETGGGTAFPTLSLTVTPRRGRLLVFHDCHPGTNTRHPDTLHAGLPVVAGRKWAFNLWFHERPFRDP
ncbi:MAG TPA: 2OG-Fe(II) oxygenase [Nannocystaceae bacterium]|nr:2OG-Fe(II) oxygenase [Nannocystaceae bacterium]